MVPLRMHFLTVLDRRLDAFEVGFHDRVVLFDGGLDEGGAVFLGLVHHVGGDFLDLEIFRLSGFVPDVGLHREQVDHADEVTFRADRQDHDERVRAEDLLHLGDDAVEIGADAVELVDVNDAGDFRVVGVAPVGFGLWLNTAGTAEHADAAVENLERTIDFDGEVHVARSVDDVELVIFPEAGGGGGLDGDAALGFLFHEVHGRCAIVNFTDLVDLAGELENTFGGGRFARINVGENADVAVFAEVLHRDNGFWLPGDGFAPGGAFLVEDRSLAILESARWVFSAFRHATPLLPDLVTRCTVAIWFSSGTNHIRVPIRRAEPT